MIVMRLAAAVSVARVMSVVGILAVVQMPAADKPDVFRVGTVNGITPGKSSRRHVISRWGKPYSTFTNEDGLEILSYNPEKGREWAIEVWCSRRTGAVYSVLLKFNHDKSKEEVERLLGLKFQWKEYKWVKCKENPHNWFTRDVSAGGEMQVYVDHSRGASASPYHLRIRSVEFRDKPYEEDVSACSPKSKKQ